MCHIAMQSGESYQKIVFIFFILSIMIIVAQSNPVIDYFPKPFIYTKNYGICIRNCAQCKKMFGPYFEGQLCADACVKFRGKLIPDCQDITSISPFLNKFE